MQLRNLAEAAPVADLWPSADMTLVDNGRRPAPAMPRALFGPAWSIIEDVADTTATAPDYAGIAYLCAAASLIGGKRWVRPYGDWREPCILWGAAVGEPSARKSQPLRTMTKPLRRIEDDAALEHAAALREWQADVERAKAERSKWQDDVKAATTAGDQTPALRPLAVEPDRPQERCALVQDITPEACAVILSGNPQGVLCYNDELAGFFESFDRYTGGGRPFWLTAYGGDEYRVTRKGAPSLHVKFTGVSVLGTIQPDKLVPLLAGANDGLVPRFLFSWPEKQPPRMPERRPNLAALETAYRRLDSLPWAMDEQGCPRPVVMPMSDAARETFHAWEKHNAASDGDGGSLFEAFVGKQSGVVARLALVAELTRWSFIGGGEPAEVSEASVAAAIQWAEDYAKGMAARVFGDAAVSETDRNAALLARYIRKNKLREINLRELKRSPHKQHLKPMQKKEPLEAAVQVLVDADWLRPAFRREGDNRGQEQLNYIVNPGIWEAVR